MKEKELEKYLYKLFLHAFKSDDHRFDEMFAEEKMSDAMEKIESYYQAKSNEEAEERYKEALGYWLSDTSRDMEALRLAAFGKEGEG